MLHLLAEGYQPKPDEILAEAFRRFVPVALIAIAFGAVYWTYRKLRSRREDARRRRWIEERRAARAARREGPGGSSAPADAPGAVAEDPAPR